MAKNKKAPVVKEEPPAPEQAAAPVVEEAAEIKTAKVTPAQLAELQTAARLIGYDPATGIATYK